VLTARFRQDFGKISVNIFHGARRPHAGVYKTPQEEVRARATGEKERAHYFLATLPENITKRQLIRIIMQRWRPLRGPEG
jgi:hypothetical protein